MSKATRVVARLPPNEPVLTAQGVPALSWLYFFQLLGRSADEVIASNLPQLVDQMLLDLVPLAASLPPADMLPSLQMPVATVDVLPELVPPVLPLPELLDVPCETAQISVLSQRISDLELWSL